MIDSIDNKVVSRIYGHGRGWVFTPRHFIDLGSLYAVGMALTRLSRKGTIRRLARGLYDYPAVHPKMGTLSASPEAVAKALAGRDAVRLQPSGAYAANLLGLSEQVPMKIVFLSDGVSRRVRVGNQEIFLKRTTPRNMAVTRIGGLVIQALKHLGKVGADPDVVKTLGKRLGKNEKAEALRQIRFAPAWIADVIRRICAEENTGKQ